MRVAIFSDVHGNAIALEAVLADIKAQGAFDHLIFAGDLIFGAHLPALCIDLIRENGIQTVYGNTDEFFWLEPDDDEEQNFLDHINWIKDKIGADGLDFLKQMPFELRLSPTDDEADDLLVVHANPKDVQRPIFPPTSYQQEKAGRIIQEDAKLSDLLDGVTARTIAFGHVHMPNMREVKGYKLVNISSVSVPQDDDWRAKYAILTFEDGHWTVERRYVAYDVATMKQDLLASGLPMAEEFANRLLLPS